MALTPTQLSLRELRKEWPLAEVVEHWNPHARIRQDLFGFIDILCVGPNGVLAVQTTSWGEVSRRVNKITEHPNLAAVREANIAIHCHGWKKVKGRWVHKCIDLS